MLAVAVGADRSLVRTGSNRLAVYAFLVGVEGSGGHAARGHYKLLSVTGSAGLRNVAVRDLGLRIAGRQNLVHAAVAVLALGDIHVAGGGRFGMNAAIVSSLLIGVAGGALGLGRRGLVGRALHIGVTVGAGEDAVRGSLELLVVDAQADLFAVLLLGHRRVVVAGQAVIVAHLRGRRGGLARFLGRRCLCNCRCEEQHGSKKNQTAAFH